MNCLGTCGLFAGLGCMFCATRIVACGGRQYELELFPFSSLCFCDHPGVLFHAWHILTINPSGCIRSPSRERKEAASGHGCCASIFCFHCELIINSSVFTGTGLVVPAADWHGCLLQILGLFWSILFCCWHDRQGDNFFPFYLHSTSQSSWMSSHQMS